MNHHEVPNIWLSALTTSSIVKRTFAPVTFSSKNVVVRQLQEILHLQEPPGWTKGAGFYMFLWDASRAEFDSPVVPCNGQSLHLCPGIQQLCPSNGGKGIGHSRHSKASFLGCIKLGTPTGQMSWDSPGCFNTEGLEIPGAIGFF